MERDDDESHEELFEGVEREVGKVDVQEGDDEQHSTHDEAADRCSKHVGTQPLLHQTQPLLSLTRPLWSQTQPLLS